MAQYSLSVPDGEYRLIAASRFQVQPPDISIGPAPDLEFFRFDSASDSYSVYTLLGGSWVGGPLMLAPGEGAIFRPTGGSANLSFQRGTMPKLPLTLHPGLNLVCCQTNIEASFEDVVGYPPANGVMLYQFNPGAGRNPFNLAAPDYTIFTFADGRWTPAKPVVGITEAVFIFQPPGLTNFQGTGVGISFDVTPPMNMPLAIEYSDSLTQPSWKVLTNVVGAGVPIRINDNFIQNSNQRFYRARGTQ